MPTATAHHQPRSAREQRAVRRSSNVQSQAPDSLTRSSSSSSSSLRPTRAAVAKVSATKQDTSNNKRGQKRTSRSFAASKKKPRSTATTLTSTSTVKRTYSLRSSNKATTTEVQALQVTPTPLVRQLDFQTESTAGGGDATALPAGVVPIFSISPCCTNSNSNNTCTCPTDVSLQQNTSLAVQHIRHYGQEFGQIMKQKEAREIAQVIGILPSEESHHLLFANANANTNFDDNDNDNDAAADETTSRPGTPRPGTVLKYKPRLLSLLSCPSSEQQVQKLPRQPHLTPKMRSILVNWLVEVSTEYKLSEDAYHLAVSLLDLVLTRGPTLAQYEQSTDEYSEDCDSDCDDEQGNNSAVAKASKPRKPFLVARNEFQALGCACTWIASKMEDKDSPSFDDFVYISDHSFSSNKLRSLETKICKDLNFRLHRVTPLHFVNEFLRASHACPNTSCEFDHSTLRHMTMYLLELSRIPYELTGRKPSLLAAASIYLARATLGMRELSPAHAVDAHGFWTKTLEHYTGYSVDDLKNTVLILHEYHLAAEESSYNAAYNKYRSRTYKSVSLKTTLRQEDLGLVEPEAFESFHDQDEDEDDEE